MPPLRLRNETTGETLPGPAFFFVNGWGRFLGMLAPGLPPGAIIGLYPCGWIHTFGLRQPLDVAYCGPNGQVIAFTQNLLPHRFDRPVRGAVATWEAAAGTFAGRVQVGDVLVASAVTGADAAKESAE